MSGGGLDTSQEVVLIAQYVIVVCCVQTCKFQTLLDVITVVLFHGSLQMFYQYIYHASILYYSGSIQLTPVVDIHG